MVEHECDVLVAGGGAGGVAAAMAAAEAGCRVVLTEETDWLGGQFTTQGVPADEFPVVDAVGSTARYRAFRRAVRAWYRASGLLTPEAAEEEKLNPGQGSVSQLCIRPDVGAAVLRRRTRHPNLAVWTLARPTAAVCDGDTVRAVDLQHALTGETTRVRAAYVLDATELGDLLPLAGAEYALGAESRDETGEPHAVDGPAQPGNVQSFTWCMAVARGPAGRRATLREPDDYAFWRDHVPALTPPWPGKLLSLTYAKPQTLAPQAGSLEPRDGAFDLWRYRRIVCGETLAVGGDDVTIMNWPQNDYMLGSILDAPAADAAEHLRRARSLSLCLLHFLRTEAGFPDLYPCPEVMGTPDGLAKRPYIREARRLRARFTVTERHVAPTPSGRCAQAFEDSVGTGWYHLDLHPSASGANYIDLPSAPYQIPLGSLIPVRVRNLLPAGKNLGVTHIANGCYRLHPTEWAVGEAAGMLAAFCHARSVPPFAVYESVPLTRAFQDALRAAGVDLAWPETALA